MSITFPRTRSFPVALLIAFIAVLGGFATPANAALSMTGLTAEPAAKTASSFSKFTISMTFGGTDYTQTTLKRLQLEFPKGQLGVVENAAVCSISQFNADNCPANTRIGAIETDATANALFIPIGVNAPGDIYRLPVQGTELARIGQIIRPGGIAGVLASDIYLQGTLRLGQNYQVLADVDGIPDEGAGFPMKINAMKMHMFGRINDSTSTSANGFFFNPSECGTATTKVTAYSHDAVNTPIPGTANYTVTDCASVPYSPSISYGPASAPASSPAEFEVNVRPGTFAPAGPKVPAPFRETALVMPEGIQLTGATNSDGNLAVCTDAQFGYGDVRQVASCPAGSKVGTVAMDSPLVGIVPGDVFLAQPETGTGHENEIIRLFMVAQQGTATDHLRVKLRAKVDMNPTTKRMEVSLVDLPAQPVKSFNFKFRAGNAPATRSPRMCGSYAGSAALKPFHTATATTVTANYAVTTGCPPAASFNPTIAMAMTPTTAGANATGVTTITLPRGDEPIDKVTASLPAGLLANIKDIPLCTRAQVGAGSCPATSKVGTVTARTGQTATTLGSFGGDIFLSEPAPSATGAVAGLFMKVPVAVGPIQVDTIALDAAVKLRTDFGLDVISPVPSELRKMEADIRDLTLNFSKSGFMVNPPVCTGNEISGAFTSTLGRNRTNASGVNVTGCDALAFSPTISFSANPASAGGASGLTTNVTLPASGNQSPPKKIVLAMPSGVSLSPSAGSSGLTGCSDAQFAKDTFADPACPGTSEIGTVTVETPTIGTLSGKAYLGTAVSGHTGRIMLDAKSTTFGDTARVKLVGLMDVDETTGVVTTTIDGIPPARFSSFSLALRGGTNPVLSMPRTCGNYDGSAALTPHAGTTVNRTATLAITANCGDANAFNPSFSNAVSPTKAGAATTMTTTVDVPERHRALDRLELSLPAGLLGKIDGAPRCTIAQANAGTCAANTELGDVRTRAGQGSNPGTFNGKLYLTDAPAAGDVVGIAVKIPAVVGPIDLGNVITIASVKLRPSDYGLDVTASVPTSVKGVPLHLQRLQLEINKPGFLQNPVVCSTVNTTAALRGQGGSTVSRSSALTPTDCAGLAFNPQVSFSANPKRAAGAGAFVTTITAPATAEQGALKKAVVELPAGVALSSSINSAGNLTGCTLAQFNKNSFADPSCAATTVIGDAELQVPQVGALTGKVYLADTAPAGAIAGLYVDAKSAAFGNAVRVKIAGSVAVDEATGKTTASFDELPAVAFSSFKMTLRGGDAPALSLPRTCGTPAGSAALSSQTGSTVNRSANLTIDENCGDADAFAPTASVTVNPTGAGAHTDLTTKVTIPAGHRELSKVAIKLPAGLLANVDGLARCTVAAAQAGTCAAGTKIGTITTKAGQGAVGGTFTGDAFLVDAPTADQILAIGLSLDVKVGPIDLGKINVVAPVTLRDDYGLDVTADVPTQVKGIPIYLRELTIAVTKPAFLFNPSRCGNKTSDVVLTSAAYAGARSTITRSTTQEIVNCDDIPFEPQIAFSAGTPRAGGASDFTTKITMPGGNAALKTATVRLPDGMSLSPSADSDSTLTGCTDAQFNKAVPGTVPTCAATSKIGTTTIQTDVVGALSGDVYLAQTAPAGALARVFVHAKSTDFPGAGVKMTGNVEVNETTGATTAVFDDAPEVPFSAFEITFRGGTTPVLSMPRVCGDAEGAAAFVSHAAGSAVNRTATLAITQSCGDRDAFNPSFANTFAPTTAGANTTMKTVIDVPQRHRAFNKLEMSLPAGTLANVDNAPRCTIVQANAGSCPGTSKLGDITAKAGQGDAPGTFTGALYLTDAPNPDSVVGIAVEINAEVGPINLGKIITIADVELRQDYGIDITADVPTRHKGIPLHLRQLTFDVTRSGFMTNPATCGATNTTVSLGAEGTQAVTRTAAFQATACDQLAFTPSVSFTAAPNTAAGPSEFTTTITAGAGAGQAALKKAVVDLPAGVALSSSINSGGDLTGCTDAQFAKNTFADPTCAATSEVGTATLEVRQVGTLTGKVYLAQTAPTGALAGLYVDAKSTQFGKNVRVKLAGKVDVDAATGKTTATFDDAPAIPFSSFALKLRGGNAPVISMPRTCGTTTGAAALTPQTGTAVSRTAGLTISSCPQADAFAPTAAVAVSPTGAGKFTRLTTTITVPSGQRELAQLDLSLPAGLLANVDGRTRCTIAQAEAGTCAAATKIGTITAKAGQGTPGGTFTGSAYLVDAPSSDEILSIGISLDVKVGPIDLGKVNVVAPVTLRDDYGLDVTAEIPTKVKGIPIYLRQLVIDIDKNDFMFNPSTCGDRTSTVALRSLPYGGTASTQTRSATTTITDCDAVDFEPQVAFLASPPKAGGASAFTTRITMPAGQAALKTATVKLPQGMSLSPSANSGGTLAGCTDAQFGKATPASAPTCAAASKIGTATVQTPTVGQLTGDVYLAQTATAPAIARIFVHAGSTQFPGAGVKMVGTVEVNEATNETTAVFTDAPEVPFTQFDIAFRGGTAPVLSMPRTCGDAAGSASFATYAGGTPKQRTANLTINESCGDADSFAPSFAASVSPTTAGANTTLTTTIAVPERHRALDKLTMKLPAGLLANVDGAPRCTIAQANAGTCAANTELGTVAAKSGQGTTPGTFTGKLFLTDAPATGDVVGIAVQLQAVVGPIDLGRITTIASVKLRPADYGIDVTATVPTHHKGIPLHLRELELKVSKPGFMTNPTSCDALSTQATLHGAGGGDVARSSAFQATNCDALQFTPSVSFSGTPAQAAGPSAFTTEITLPAGQKALKTAVVDLPTGVALSSSINSDGALTGCTAAQFNKDEFPDPTCAASSELGTATIQVPQVGTLAGKVYLAQTTPAGAIAGLYVDAKSATFGASVRVKIAGKVDVDASGKTTATFADVPSIAFTSFKLALRGGNNPAISMPRTCGTPSGDARLTPQSGAAVSRSATLTVNANCTEADKFAATGTVALSSSAAGQHTNLTTTITVPTGQRELEKVDIALPAGLLANVDGLPTCTVVAAKAGDCAANTKIGTITTKAGQGATGGTFAGDVFLTEAPREGDILGIALQLKVLVGPIDLGQVNVVAPVTLRSDYGLDVTADVPTRVKNIPIYLRQLVININKPNFLFNPSTCGAKSTSITLGSAAYAGDRSSVTANSTQTITACDTIAFAPTVAFSASPAKAGESGAFTTTIALPASPMQSALKDATVTLPEGMSLSPSIDASAQLTGCTPAQFDRPTPGTTPDCPAAAKIGTTKIQTTSVGELTGNVYLASSATAGNLARVFVHATSAGFPGAGVKLAGDVAVNEATGRVTAVFNDAPEVPFTRMEITFRGGADPVLSLPRTAGAKAGSASLSSHAGGAVVNATANLTVTANAETDKFTPAVQTTTSPSTAAAATALTTKISVPAGQQELSRVRLSLPAGLLAKIKDQPLCELADAAAGSCPATTKVGTLSAKAGQGDGGVYSGGTVYLTKAPSAGAIVGLAIELPVKVGKVGSDAIIDLGKVTQTGAISLRRDYGVDIDMAVPTKHKGIALYLRELTITLDKPGFMINPATCTGNAVTGTLDSEQNGSAAVNAGLTITDCAAINVTPTAGFTASPSSAQPQPAGAAPALTTKIGLSGANPAPLKKTVVELPAGVSLTASANAAGDLAGCTAAQFAKDDWSNPACPAGSRIGTVAIDTPSVGAVTGDAYLAQTAPAGAIAGLYIDAQSSEFGAKARIKLAGSVVVDAATGKTTATFDDLPGVAFTEFALTLRGGSKPVMSLPRTCGAHAGRVAVTPFGGGAERAATGTLTLASCPPANQFAPTVDLALSPNGAGASGNLTTTITVPGGDQELGQLQLDMPEGLTAKLQGVPRCTIAAAQAANCPANTKLGAVSAKVGVAGAPFTQTGEAFLTAGRNGHIAGMALILDAKVGPIDLGKVITIADIDLRSPDLAMRITSDVPTQVKGVRLDIRELAIGITRSGFLVNPSSCGPVSGTAAFTSVGDRTASDDATVTIDAASCATQSFEPKISFGADNAKVGEASNFTTTVDMSAGTGAKSPFKAIAVTLPSGMSLSASAGASGTLAGCTDAQFKQDDLASASACPAGSKIGSVKFETELVGDLTGDAYLAPATSGNLARLFLETKADPAVVENLTVRLIGEVRVNETTGATQIAFDKVPAIPVTKFTVTVQGGSAPVLAMPRECGPATGTGAFTPVNGGAAKTDSATLNVTDCAPSAFEPTASVDRSTTDAGRAMTFSTKVTLPKNSQELSGLNMTLPAGLLGKISSVPACAIADARAGTCAAASQVGTVAAKVGVHSALFTVPGSVYLAKGDANSIARLAIVLPAKVGPIDLGNVVTLAELKLRGDYGLTISAPEIPTRVKGVRLDLHQLDLAIDRADFMVNPVTCGDTTAAFTLRSAQNGAKSRSQALSTGNCAALQLNAAVSWGANPASPLTASEVTTRISAAAPAGSALDAIKTMRVTMPEGMSLSPSAGARGDLAECTPGAFRAADIDTDAACPAGSKVGTVRIVSPMVGELTGDAYLGEKTAGHFAGLYLQAKAADYPSLRVKLAGQIDVNETDGRMTAVFEDLPQVQVAQIDLSLRGGDAPVIALPRTCGSFGGDVAVLRHGGGASSAAGGLTLDTDCPDPGAFGPTLDLGVSNPQAGATTALATTVKVPARHQELTSMAIDMPRGLLGKLTVVPRCSVADAQADRCGAETAVGSVSAKVGAASAPFTTRGTVYMTEGYDGGIAGLMFSLPAKVGPIDLGNVVTIAKVELVGAELQMRITANGIPTRVKGIPLSISELAITVDKPGVIVNAASCGAASAGASFGSLQGGSAGGSAGYQAQGCGNLAYNPEFSLSFSGSAADLKKLGRPTISTVIKQTEGQGNLRKAEVLLPAGVATDLKNINARVCASAGDAAAGNCPEASVLGPVAIKTSALPGTLNGKIHLVKIPGATLPGLAIRIRDQIAFDIVGTTKLNSAGLVQVVFDGMPDTPISEMTLVFSGGANGVIQLGSEICGVAGLKTDATLTAQHGASKKFDVPVNCNGVSAPQQNLNSALTSKTAITMKPSGSGSAMTFALSNPNGIKQVSLTMPKGAIFTKKAKKYVKPKLTGAKAKVKVTNGARKMRIVVTPTKKGGKVTKIKFTLPKKAIKINIKVRKILANKKLSKKKRAAQLAKVLKPKVVLLDALGKSVVVPITMKVSASTKITKKKK